MARPCGCSGECGCTINGLNGITVSGQGTTGQPYQVRLSNPLQSTGCDAIMSCVNTRLGRGLTVSSDSKIQVNLANGGGLDFDANGALFATGGGGGGNVGFATVAGLLARPITEKIIGGSYGAGLCMQWEGPLESYRVAASLGLPLIHVPVRRSREGALWAAHYHALGYYNDGLTAKDLTHTINLSRGQVMKILPGGKPRDRTDNFMFNVPAYEFDVGPFGDAKEMSVGLPRLTDVFEIIQRRSVLYLEIKDLGSSIEVPNNQINEADPKPAAHPETPNPDATFAALEPLLGQYGVTQSVIVGANLPTALSAGDRTSMINGLTRIRNAGAAIAWHFNSVAEMTANPPATLTGLGVTWAFFPYHVAETNPAQLNAYKAAGITCMLHSLHRQHQFNFLNKAEFNPGGLRGGISWDPVYVNGSQSNFRYRALNAVWDTPDPNHGRQGPYVSGNGFRPEWQSQNNRTPMSDHFRGLITGALSDRGRLLLTADVIPPGETDGGAGSTAVQTGYNILMGEQCPVPWPQYDIDFDVRWHGDTNTIDGRYMGIIFGVDEDREVKEWIRCDQYSKFYLFALSITGTFVFFRYDGIPYPGNGAAYQYTFDWASGYNTPGPGGNTGASYGLKVRVRNDRLVLGPSNQDESGANTRIFTATTPAENGTGRLPDATRWRGKYFYMNRHFWNTSNSRLVSWENLRITEIP